VGPAMGVLAAHCGVGPLLVGNFVRGLGFWESEPLFGPYLDFFLLVRAEYSSVGVAGFRPCRLWRGGRQ